MLDGLGLNKMADTVTKAMTEDGIKVVATVEDSVYMKLGATIVASVVIAAIGYYMVQSLFK